MSSRRYASLRVRLLSGSCHYLQKSCMVLSNALANKKAGSLPWNYYELGCVTIVAVAAPCAFGIGLAKASEGQKEL